MFKLLKSAVRIGALRTSRYDIQLPALYTTFQPREFQYETSDGESGTLIHQFSRHIALNKRDFTDPTKYNFKYSAFYPVYKPDQFLEQLRNISTHDLGKLICLTSDSRGKSDTRLFTDVVNALDEEAETRVDGSSFSELVGLMHGFMYLLPNKITKLATYRKAMPRLVELFGANVNQKDFMTVLFFLGMWKKNAAGNQLMSQFMQDHLEQFLAEEMGLLDFVILANASYKMSVRIRSERFRERLVEEICGFKGNEMALLVTLVKCARMNRIRSERIMEKFRDVLQKDVRVLDFRGLSHLFAFVADSLIKEDSLTSLFVEECSKRVETEILNKESESISQSFRAKDLSTFLWSCSALSIPLSQLGVEPNDLVNQVFQKVENGEYRYIPDTLVDTCLSLWIMNHQSVNMLSSIFSDRQFVQHFKKDRVKIESRRDLLLACAEIERPEAFKIISKLPRPNAFQLSRQAPEYLVKNRAELQRVKACLEGAKEQLRITDVQYNLPVKFLNIAGLLLKLEGGEQLNVDVLERGYCLSDHQTPTGLMGLKARLLETMREETVSINSTSTATDEQLVQTLEEAIRNMTQTKKPRQSRKTG